jgi:hypothetical protein
MTAEDTAADFVVRLANRVLDGELSLTLGEGLKLKAHAKTLKDDVAMRTQALQRLGSLLAMRAPDAADILITAFQTCRR